MSDDMRGAAGRLIVLSVLVVLAAQQTATATPVATTEDERETLGRTFLEPSRSVDYIQFTEDPGTGTSEYVDGMQLLEDLYPGYLEFTTVAEQLDSQHAVSTGEDGHRPWEEDDTGDGLPLHVTILTDESVPDGKKQYAAFMSSHQREPCGREGLIRSVEDMLIWATENPERTLSNATGLSDETVEMSVEEILRRTKIYVLSVSPDGWAAGDRRAGLTYSQQTGNGFNSNRIAYQTGFVYPADPVYREAGFSVLTESEGAAVTKYLNEVRETELDGRPFAVGADIHGPAPVGMILLHDQSNSPRKLLRIEDLAQRVQNSMTAVRDEYMTELGGETYEEITGGADDASRDARRAHAPLHVPLRWAAYGHISDLIWKTVTGSWGGWMNSGAGLAADALSFEMTCRAWTWEPQEQQIFQDVVRSIFQTMIVTAAGKPETAAFERSVGGEIGFYAHGGRVTSADGNPSPPPQGYPGHPLVSQIRQQPYDVSNTDYFRDLRRLLTDHVAEVGPDEVGAGLVGLDSFVVADATVRDVEDLRPFVAQGGNLVLTDRALQMLPELVPDATALDVRREFGYVGYADLDFEHPFAEGLNEYARQTYDPIGPGHELFVDRDDYWYTSTDESSGTKNSAPIWTVSRDAWEAAGGETIGTADPPESRTGTQEGDDTNRMTIGTLPMGEGRIVVFGGLLPRPTEENPHWFGLEPYAISTTGQSLLLRALEWSRPGSASAGVNESRETTTSDRDELGTTDRRTPATGSGPAIPLALMVSGLAVLLLLGGRRRS